MKQYGLLILLITALSICACSPQIADENKKELAPLIYECQSAIANVMGFYEREPYNIDGVVNEYGLVKEHINQVELKMKPFFSNRHSEEMKKTKKQLDEALDDLRGALWAVRDMKLSDLNLTYNRYKLIDGGEKLSEFRNGARNYYRKHIDKAIKSITEISTRTGIPYDPKPINLSPSKPPQTQSQPQTKQSLSQKYPNMVPQRGTVTAITKADLYFKGIPLSAGDIFDEAAMARALGKPIKVSERFLEIGKEGIWLKDYSYDGVEVALRSTQPGHSDAARKAVHKIYSISVDTPKYITARGIGTQSKLQDIVNKYGSWKNRWPNSSLSDRVHYWVDEFSEKHPTISFGILPDSTVSHMAIFYRLN